MLVICLLAYPKLKQYVLLLIYFFEKNLDFKISKAGLKKPFQFATYCTHFMFDGRFYNQIDGVAMGSVFSHALANLFMVYYE